jgi:acetyl-CoA C-acetyltransferase
MTREVVVLSAVRSAIGAFGGSLSDMEPAELAGSVMKEAVVRSGVDPQQINYVTVGNCIRTPWPCRSIVCALPVCRGL